MAAAVPDTEIRLVAAEPEKDALANFRNVCAVVPGARDVATLDDITAAAVVLHNLVAVNNGISIWFGRRLPEDDALAIIRQQLRLTDFANLIVLPRPGHFVHGDRGRVLRAPVISCTVTREEFSADFFVTFNIATVALRWVPPASRFNPLEPQQQLVQRVVDAMLQMGLPTQPVRYIAKLAATICTVDKCNSEEGLVNKIFDRIVDGRSPNKDAAKVLALSGLSPVPGLLRGGEYNGQLLLMQIRIPDTAEPEDYVQYGLNVAAAKFVASSPPISHESIRRMLETMDNCIVITNAVARFIAGHGQLVVHEGPSGLHPDSFPLRPPIPPPNVDRLLRNPLAFIIDPEQVHKLGWFGNNVTRRRERPAILDAYGGYEFVLRNGPVSFIVPNPETGHAVVAIKARDDDEWVVIDFTAAQFRFKFEPPTGLMHEVYRSRGTLDDIMRDLTHKSALGHLARGPFTDVSA